MQYCEISFFYSNANLKGCDACTTVYLKCHFKSHALYLTNSHFQTWAHVSILRMSSSSKNLDNHFITSSHRQILFKLCTIWLFPLDPQSRNNFFCIVNPCRDFTCALRAGETGDGQSHSVWTRRGPLYERCNTRNRQQHCSSRLRRYPHCRNK